MSILQNRTIPALSRLVLDCYQYFPDKGQAMETNRRCKYHEWYQRKEKGIQLSMIIIACLSQTFSMPLCTKTIHVHVGNPFFFDQ